MPSNTTQEYRPPVRIEDLALPTWRDTCDTNHLVCPDLGMVVNTPCPVHRCPYNLHENSLGIPAENIEFNCLLVDATVFLGEEFKLRRAGVSFHQLNTLSPFLGSSIADTKTAYLNSLVIAKSLVRIVVKSNYSTVSNKCNMCNRSSHMCQETGSDLCLEAAEVIEKAVDYYPDLLSLPDLNVVKTAIWSLIEEENPDLAFPQDTLDSLLQTISDIRNPKNDK